MTYARITKLACGLLAAAALTACGGGGEKGPVWAQEAKQVLLSPPDDTTPETPVQAQEFSPATYFSDCTTIPFVLNGASLAESDQVSYQFVETPTGTQLYIKHTLFVSTTCEDTGNNKQAEIVWPVYHIERAGQASLIGYASVGLNASGPVLGNLQGIRILMTGEAGDVQISVFNGATVADAQDPQLGAVKVITSSLGNVLFNNSPTIDETVAKDVIYRQNDRVYFGRQSSSDDTYYDDLGYPNSVDLDLPFFL